jgi:prepilin-type N-terminal cleavage/methylation domain-containing protein/prepilin-type processing-associated H-X9-DG protein
MRYRGFTLIELLVVIAVIALLIGILLPALSGARLSARVLACGARLQQMGVASTAYVDDFRGALPQVLVDAGGPEPSPVGALFAGKKGVLPFLGINEYGAQRRPLNRYLGVDDPAPDAQPGVQEVEPARSPIDRGAESTGLPIPEFERTDSMYDFIGVSYSLNDHAPDDDPTRDAVPTLVPPTGGRMPRVERPSLTVLIGTQSLYNYDDGNDRGMRWFGSSQGSGEILANVLFLDAHVGLRLPVPEDRASTTPDYTFLPGPG